LIALSIFTTIFRKQHTLLLMLSLKLLTGGYQHHIDNEPAAGEGFVSNGVKFVPRKFTEANRKRSAALKAKKTAQSVI